MRRLVLLLALMAFIAVPVSSYAIVEVAIGSWSQSPSGDLAYEGDSMDLEKDFGFSDESKIFGRAKLELPIPLIPNIYLMSTPMEFSGSAIKNLTFDFGGVPFTAGVPFDTTVTMDSIDVALYYSVPGLSLATAEMFNVDFGLDIRVIDFAASVKQPQSGLSESVDLNIPLPLLYLGAQLHPLPMLGIEAEIRGLSVGDNKYTDIIGRVRYNAVGPLFVAVGYRTQSVTIKDSGVDAEIDFSGAFLEAGFNF